MASSTIELPPMILIPAEHEDRAFTVDWFLEDVTRGRVSPADAKAMLAELRLAGDLANLERIARVVADLPRA